MADSGTATRVLLVGPSLDIIGGQSIQLERLRRALAGSQAVQLRFEPVNPRLPSILAGLQRIRYLRTLVTEAWYLGRLLLDIPRAQVLHVYSASYWSFLLAPAPAIALGRLLGKKVILNYHSGEAADHLARWGWHALPIIRMASLVVVQSEYLSQVFREHGLHPAIIPNSLNLEAFTWRNRAPLRARFLSNRNHEIHYGVDTVLRAFALIQSRLPDASLVVAGSGSLTPRLEALAGELALRQVAFIGAVAPEAMQQCYEASDVLLNGSSIDNMPLSILEAFACGVPVVSTAAGGIPNLVQHEDTGLLAAVGDHRGLAEQALRLFQEPGLAGQLAERARAVCAAEYSDSRVASAWTKTYRTVSGRAG